VWVIAGAIASLTLCICLAGLLFWRLSGSRAVAVNNPAPTLGELPTLAATPTAIPTNTPSPEDLLSQLPPERAVFGRQLLDAGLPARDLPTLEEFMRLDRENDELYSMSDLEAQLFNAMVDISSYFAGTFEVKPLELTGPLWDNDPFFGCKARKAHAVACAQDHLPTTSGNLLIASMQLAEPIPAPSAELGPDQPRTIPTGDTMLIYALVIDRDGDPSNNFTAQPPYDWDYFQGSDTWYELLGDPEYGLWELHATDASRRPFPSTARAVVEGNTITFILSADEIGDPSQATFRMSAFLTDGSYAPETSTGDVTGANPTEPLQPFDDTGLTLAGPQDGQTSAPEGSPTATEAAAATSEATPTQMVDVEAQARTFIGQFSQAQEMQDVDFLVDHLAQATLDRYGEAQCRSYLETHAGTATDIQVQSLTYPEPFDYTTDGLSTVIPDSILVDITLQALGTPTTGSLHLLMEAGQFKWFTDCGTPLN
jgi:hypothetical protein